MTTHTATVETLTAEVRVLMVGSRQVTLSVYRQLDRQPPDEVVPFGRVSDKQDDAPEYGERNVFVVGRDLATGALARAERLVRNKEPERLQDFIDRRHATEEKRHYRNQRASVKPFTEERRNGERRQKHRRIAGGHGTWFWAENVGEYEARLLEWEEDNAKHEEWMNLPLIVLAGLR